MEFPSSERLADEAPWLPVAAVMATIITWGFASPLVKFASPSGPTMAFYRLTIGVAALLIAMRSMRTAVTMRGLRWAALGGALFGVNILMFVGSIKMTTVANATLIGALQPAIVTAVAGPLFGESVTRREVTCVAGAILGVGIVILGSAGTPEWNPAGDALAVGAVLSFTAYFLVSKRARASVGTLEYMTGVHVAAAFVAAPVALSNPADFWPLSGVDIAIVLFFALVSGTLGQVVIGWAHRYVDVSVSSLLMLAVPVVAMLCAWPLLGEAIGPVQAAGAAVTLGAIAMMMRRPQRAVAVEPVLAVLPEGQAGGVSPR
jgi:drug/metabolite transporter (DMT)-like permease